MRRKNNNNKLIIKTITDVTVIFLDKISNTNMMQYSKSIYIYIQYINGRDGNIVYEYNKYNTTQEELLKLVKEDFNLILNSLIKYNNTKSHISSTYEKK